MDDELRVSDCDQSCATDNDNHIWREG